MFVLLLLEYDESDSFKGLTHLLLQVITHAWDSKGISKIDQYLTKLLKCERLRNSIVNLRWLTDHPDPMY